MERTATQTLLGQSAPTSDGSAASCPLFPASASQKSLWFLHQFAPESPVYHLPYALRLRGPLNVPALEKSLDAIIARQASLRTTFQLQGQELLQRVTPHRPFRLPSSDAAGLSGLSEAEIGRHLAQSAIAPFDALHGPLARFTLFRLSETDHILLTVFHHVIADGWSIGVYFQELAAAYAAHCASAIPALPALPLQYTDYAVRQHGREPQRLAPLAQYWKTKLAGAPPALELPADFRRPPVASFRGEWVVESLDPALCQRLSSLARQQKVTPFILLLTAFKILLFRYSGQEDLVVGCPIANRSSPDTANLMGFFVNMLALRTSLAGDPTFSALLQRVTATVMEALAHQEMPFERLVDLLQTPRDPGRLPMVSIQFALQNLDLQCAPMADLECALLPVPLQTAEADLVFLVYPRQDTWACHVHYATDLFSAARIQRLLGHWTVLLQGILADPHQRISQMPLLTEAERQQLLVEWNRTSRTYPRDLCVHEVFAQHACLHPEALALVYQDASLTYRDLDQRSNQLAHYLARWRVGPGTPVCVFLPPSAEMVLCLLAILKAGGAYVPLDERNPKERLAFMLKDAAPPVLLTRRERRGQLPDLHATILCLEEAWEAISQENPTPPANRVGPESVAYLMYTSGSTGDPKGVAVPHRAITRLVLNSNYLELGASDRLAQVANLAFDAATFEIWGALLNGAQLIGIPAAVALSPQDLALTLRQHGITVLFLTTAWFHEIAAQLPAAFASLRTLLVGGEALDPRLARMVLGSQPPQRLVNVYGPTENTTFTSFFDVRTLAPEAESVPIGRPIANTQVYLLDRQGNPVPPGIPGELCTGGDGLACGYWNQPDLTAARFRSNPFTSAPGSKLYHTGDLCRWQETGVLEFLGRLDDQVKSAASASNLVKWKPP